MYNRIGKGLEKINIEQLVKRDVPLHTMSSFKTGGNADYYAQPKDLDELIILVRWAKEQSLDYTVLGGATNVLISDDGVEGLVISTISLTNYHIRGRLFVVEAGLLVDTAINIAIENFLSGLEDLGGLPGTIGGAVWGNSQAANLSLGELIEWIDYVDSEGSLRRLHAIDAKFEYKNSPFMGKKNVIYEVALRLEPNKNTSEARLKKEAQRRIRIAKGQFDYPSAGCFFKNINSISSGKLIDEANLKSLTYGNASISQSHANFIVNKNNLATSSDIYNLAKMIQKEIFEKHSIELELEVSLIGRWNS